MTAAIWHAAIWHHDGANVRLVVRWLAAHDYTADEIAAAMGVIHNYYPEFLAAIAERDATVNNSREEGSHVR